MSTSPASQAQSLAARIGYEPRDLALFVVALTHRSSEGPNNERLEFLGDSVLNLLLSERLYREFPNASEGDLSRLRARLVAEPGGEQLRLGCRRRAHGLRIYSMATVFLKDITSPRLPNSGATSS